MADHGNVVLRDTPIRRKRWLKYRSPGARCPDERRIRGPDLLMLLGADSIEASRTFAVRRIRDRRFGSRGRKIAGKGSPIHWIELVIAFKGIQLTRLSREADLDIIVRFDD